MSSIGPKPVRLRLEAVAYESLRRQVLRRDGWRCQSCGTMSNAARCRTWKSITNSFRSHSGHHAEENLITLCSTCHASAHGETGQLVRSKDVLRYRQSLGALSTEPSILIDVVSGSRVQQK